MTAADTLRQQGGERMELISIYPENSKEIFKTLRDLDIGFKLLGPDQSQRLIVLIRYGEYHSSNVAIAKETIRTMECARVAGLLIADLFSAFLNKIKSIK